MTGPRRVITPISKDSFIPSVSAVNPNCLVHRLERLRRTALSYKFFFIPPALHLHLTLHVIVSFDLRVIFDFDNIACVILIF